MAAQHHRLDFRAYSSLGNQAFLKGNSAASLLLCRYRGCLLYRSISFMGVLLFSSPHLSFRCVHTSPLERRDSRRSFLSFRDDLVLSSRRTFFDFQL